MSEPLTALREWRKSNDVTFDDLVKRLGQEFDCKTTKATLSRAEAGIHPLDTDVAKHLKVITGLPGIALRPDLADLMQSEAAE